jgi:integrase
MNMKLTKRAIDGFEYKGGWDVRWDDTFPGFGVRIYPTGKKSFVISYRHAGRKRLMVLGAFGILTLDQAREMAREKMVGVVGGGDPLDEKRKGTRGASISDLCEAYIERHASKKKSGKIDIGWLNRFILPRWRNVPIASLKRSDVAALHHDIGKKTPYQANRVVEVIQKMFQLAKVWGFLNEAAINPGQGIDPFKEKKRDRWVSPEELPKLAEAIDQESNIYASAALWLYLLTGARKTEILAARWEDLDWSRKELRLSDTKAGRVHYIPLSAPAMIVLESIPHEEGNPYILPGRKPGQHLVNISKPWNRIRKAAGIEDVRIHDLRRTLGSWMAQAGNSLHLIGRVLNHSNASTTQVYARFGQDTVRDALEAHGQKIMAVAGKKPTAEIIPLKKQQN